MSQRSDNPGGRPRKYANDAEKARAFRERWATISVRCEPRTKETLRTIAAVADFTEADIVNAAVKFYAVNFDPWRQGLIYGGRMPTIQDKATRERMERERANKEFLESEGE